MEERSKKMRVWVVIAVVILLMAIMIKYQKDTTTDGVITGVGDGEIAENVIESGQHEIYKVIRDIDRVLDGEKPQERYRNENVNITLRVFYQEMQERENQKVDLEALKNSYKRVENDSDSYEYDLKKVDKADTEGVVEASNGIKYIQTKDIVFDEYDNAKIVVDGYEIDLHKSEVRKTLTEVRESMGAREVVREGDTVEIRGEGGNKIKVMVYGEGLFLDDIEIQVIVE